MPLINSPIDGAPMRPIHRYGIEFDVCPATGGVWLDKGELEKLIALVKEETLQQNGAHRVRSDIAMTMMSDTAIEVADSTAAHGARVWKTSSTFSPSH